MITMSRAEPRMCIHVIRGLNALTAVAIGLACLSLLPLISGCGHESAASPSVRRCHPSSSKLTVEQPVGPSAAFSEASSPARNRWLQHR